MPSSVAASRHTFVNRPATAPSRLFGALVRAESAIWIFAIAVSITYAAIPLALVASGYQDSAYKVLVSITVVGVVCALLGRVLATPTPGGRPVMRLGVRPFLIVSWSLFGGFALLAWATADQIPLVAYLQGADTETVNRLREEFLKGRGGWQSVFVYVNAGLSGALIPYCIAVMFLKKVKYRWFLLGLFGLYSLSFVEKAFFIKAVAPIFYLLCRGKLRWNIKPIHLVLGSLLTLLTLFVVSRGGDGFAAGGGGDFFESNYTTKGPVDQFFWRSFSVPLFTTIDSLKAYQTYFDRPLMGATSSLLAAIMGAQRVPFERMIFSYQWGQLETGTGSSNSVYLTEAFVNFSWIGVVGFSLSIGYIFRLFARSRDEAFRALWPLFFLNVYSAGLIGTLLSNGFILVILVSTFGGFGVVGAPSRRVRAGRSRARPPGRRSAPPWAMGVAAGPRVSDSGARVVQSPDPAL